MVMNNVFRTDVPLHAKYDLKGSTKGRTIGSRMSATGEGMMYMFLSLAKF